MRSSTKVFYIRARKPVIDDNMTYEVPQAEDVTDDASGAMSSMMEGAASGVGIELGGATVPVIGEALGGFVASLALSRQTGKNFTNRLAAYKAVERLLA